MSLSGKFQIVEQWKFVALESFAVLKFWGSATKRSVVLVPLRHIAGPLFLVMVVGPRIVKAMKPG